MQLISILIYVFYSIPFLSFPFLPLPFLYLTLLSFPLLYYLSMNFSRTLTTCQAHHITSSSASSTSPSSFSSSSVSPFYFLILLIPWIRDCERFFPKLFDDVIACSTFCMKDLPQCVIEDDNLIMNSSSLRNVLWLIHL